MVVLKGMLCCYFVMGRLMLHYESADCDVCTGQSQTLHSNVVIKESVCKKCSLLTDLI